jgi:hypothetical protein
LHDISGRLSNLQCSNEEQDAKAEEDDEEDTELGKISGDNEPGWVMSTNSKIVTHHIASIWQKKMRLD